MPTVYHYPDGTVEVVSSGKRTDYLSWAQAEQALAGQLVLHSRDGCIWLGTAGRR